MALRVLRKKKFEKDVKLAKKRGKNLDKLKTVLKHLADLFK